MKNRIPPYASNIITFVIFWIIFTSILLPILILTLFPKLALNVPVEINALYQTAIIESTSLIFSYIIYHSVTKHAITAKSINFEHPTKLNLIDSFLLYSSVALVSTHSAFNILSPASYLEVNEIGSSSGFGGSLALATLYPLLVSVIIASATYILLDELRRNTFLLKILILTLIATAISGVLSGGRMAILYPFMPYLLKNVIKFGALGTFRKYAPTLFITLPLLGIFVVISATLRVGDHIEDIGNSFDFIGLFFTHLYLKFSGITNSTFLNINANAEDYGSALTALSGTLTTFIPRFIFEDKAISGSLNGTESGLPYRIAANVLGYDDYGNVVLSPSILSYWLAGPWGIIANTITIAAALILVHVLLIRGLQYNSPIYIALSLYTLGMPHFLAFYVDFTQGISLLIRVSVVYFVLVLLTKLLKHQKITVKLN